MEKMFWVDPYLSEIKATVIEKNNDWLLFDKTIAFSFSGGQESDEAWINDCKILESKIVGNNIYYRLSADHPFNSSDIITMKINWERRFKLMRLHFAAELILELVVKYYHLEKIGAHISESKARIDFIFDGNISDIFSDLLTKYNAIIDKDLKIHKDYLDFQSQRRYWEIEGFARVPCGGTHVKSTQEVGYISLKRKNIGKSKERIEICLVHI